MMMLCVSLIIKGLVASLLKTVTTSFSGPISGAGEVEPMVNTWGCITGGSLSLR